MRLSKTTAITFLICAVALVLGCGPGQAGDGRGGPTPDVPDAQTATVAGGCFWCVESAFDGVPGVIHAISGYTGGESKDPTYEQVSSGRSGHVEAVEIRFDPDIISYEEVLDIFWRQIDPTDPGGQFADRGSQYQTYIFTHDEQQAEIARRTKAELGASGRFGAPIVTEIVPAKTFYPAEDYHQDYHLKQPERYKRYAYGSGRIPFLQRVWGDAKPSEARSKPSSRGAGFDGATFVKPTDEQLREMLDPLQYQVTQEEGTERAFTNEYWNNKGEGIYVDIVSGEPLFSSTDKYASGSGWPAFTRPLEPDNIVEKIDHKMYVPRTEVRSKHADSHLGHVFDDGPQPTGLRYCINSAALRFIPKKDLEREGYGEYLKLFESSGKH